MPINYTAIAMGAAANAAIFNSPLTELDTAIKKNNYTATAAPTTGDDTGDGYSVGSRWFDVTNDFSYVCLDATLGAAIWGQALRGLTNKFYINDNSNANLTIGLTINQGAADDEILTLKSSDVAHGMSNRTATNAYAAFKKGDGAAGGLDISGYSESTNGLYLNGAGGSNDTTKSTVATSQVRINSQLKSGTSVTALDANANILTVQTNGTTRFIMDGDGDSHQDVGTAWTNFDNENDLELLTLLSAHVTRADDPLRDTFGAWLEKNRAPLERLRLVTFNPDGHHFVNMSRLNMLLVGAVRQMGERLANVVGRMDALEQKLMKATNG